MTQTKNVPRVIQQEVPPLDAALISWLEQTYPDRAIDTDVPQREADKQLGKILLVRSLRTHFDRQTASVLRGSK